MNYGILGDDPKGGYAIHLMNLFDLVNVSNKVAIPWFSGIQCLSGPSNS